MSQRSRSYNESNIVSIHICFFALQLYNPFLRYRYFKIWPWKSKVKDMGGVTGQGHIMGSMLYWFISLLLSVNLTIHSWDMSILKFGLKNPRSMSPRVKGQMTQIWVNIGSYNADIAKTSGLLPDQRTSKHVENSGFTSPLLRCP